MNLLELMLKEEVEWPVGAEYAVQDDDGEKVKFGYGRTPILCNTGIWHRDVEVAITPMQCLASDWSTRIITREEYQAAGGKMLISSADYAATSKNQSVDATLTERGNRYGKFKDHAELSQKLKETMYCADGWEYLSSDMREALEMIQHKVARILNGDPTYADSWHDIAGYAKLVDDRLNGVER